jgi:O-acetyl-ADP-ribose deacetylase (regulator of RNase III)
MIAEMIEIVEGDITKQKVDAIVNAANTTLLGGGGVDGAIHRAAGPRLLEECRGLNGCATGEARITHGYDLPARWIIHTAGPIWRGGQSGETGLLADCYRNCLALAGRHSLRTLAFPAISTGAYGYPIRDAARVALRTVADYLRAHPDIELVRFTLFSADDLAVYQDAAREIL